MDLVPVTCQSTVPNVTARTCVLSWVFVASKKKKILKIVIARLVKLVNKFPIFGAYLHADSSLTCTIRFRGASASQYI